MGSGNESIDQWTVGPNDGRKSLLDFDIFSSQSSFASAPFRSGFFLPWQVSFKVATLGESLIKFSQNCLPCNNKVEKLQNYCKFLGSLLICLTNSAVTVRWENLYFPANPS